MAERLRLTDRQCRLFLRDIREFGYADVTFETIRKLADRYAEGADVDGDAVGMILRREIEEAQEAAKGRN